MSLLNICRICIYLISYYGGWLCENIYYLGHSGVVNFGELKIMGISGILNERFYKCGYFEEHPYSHLDKKSVYCTREYEIAKCCLYSKPIDIIFSHDWPSNVYSMDSLKDVLFYKPFWKKDVLTKHLGNKHLDVVLETQKPKLWVSAHLHAFFTNKVGPTEYNN